MSITTIIFDLDGTLIDSASDLQALLEPTLRRDGRRPLSIEETRQCIGWGMIKLVERAFTMTGPPLDPATHDAVIAEFKARYEAADPSPAQVYPGVAETLATLRPGYRIGLCTNKPARATERCSRRSAWLSTSTASAAATAWPSASPIRGTCSTPSRAPAAPRTAP